MENNIDLEVVCVRNDDTVVKIQLSSDSEETESDSNYLESFHSSVGDSVVFTFNSIENHKRDVNRIRKKYYVWIRSLFAILISVGYPLHNWLISGDSLRDSYNKCTKVWIIQQRFYGLLDSMVFLAMIIMIAFMIVEIPESLKLIHINFIFYLWEF